MAATDPQRGFAWMVQTLIDNPQIKLEIFPDMKSAEEWLRIAKAPSAEAP